jgi:nicotinamide riboside kinase
VGALTPKMTTRPLIAVVGPCKSGKSTLIKGLQEHGFTAKQIAQEHSFAPSMWQKIGKPDFLIYLHCEYESTIQRGIVWTQSEYEEQQPRLAHARENADLLLKTDIDSPESVLEKAINFLDFEARNKPLS